MADKYKNAMDTVRSGSIMMAYTQTHLINVQPTFGIDKIRWSIVKQDTKGKEYIDYWMKVREMYLFCLEIDNGLAWQKFAADAASQYPSAYQYATGIDACMHLKIGGGQKGIRIQIQENPKGQKSKYMQALVTYADLQYLSLMFKIVSGLMPVSGYYKKLYDAFWEGEEEYQKKRQGNNSGDYSDYTGCYDFGGGFSVPAPSAYQQGSVQQPATGYNQPAQPAASAPSAYQQGGVQQPVTGYNQPAQPAAPAPSVYQQGGVQQPVTGYNQPAQAGSGYANGNIQHMPAGYNGGYYNG